jgi:hypothetical protein
MRHIIYILILLTFGCKQNVQVKKDSSVSNFMIDSIDITVWATNPHIGQTIKASDKVIKLNKSQIIESESLLRDYIIRYNIDGLKRVDSLSRHFSELKHKKIQINKKYILIDLKNYGRQYVAVLDSSNHLIVYINCFCNPTEFEDRHSNWIMVEDGENCFFQVQLDLTTKKIKEFSINGVA